jgi:hypothetical protein
MYGANLVIAIAGSGVRGASIRGGARYGWNASLRKTANEFHSVRLLWPTHPINSTHQPNFSGICDEHSFRRVEVLTGTRRRRRWSAAQKAAIIAESLAPGAATLLTWSGSCWRRWSSKTAQWCRSRSPLRVAGLDGRITRRHRDRVYHG